MDAGAPPGRVRVFVGGLPPGVGAAEVAGRFAAFGEVEGVELPADGAVGAEAGGGGGGHRGFAFLDLRATPSAVQRCISTYHGCEWAGHRMCVARARERWTARFEREAALDAAAAAAAAETAAAARREADRRDAEDAAAWGGAVGGGARSMLLGRGPSGKRLKVRLDGGEDKHRRHRTFFPPGKPRGPPSWECAPRLSAEARHLHALGLEIAPAALPAPPSRPAEPALPDGADASGVLQRLLEEGRAYVDARFPPPAEAPEVQEPEFGAEAAELGVVKLLARHGYASGSDCEDGGGEAGGADVRSETESPCPGRGSNPGGRRVLCREAEAKEASAEAAEEFLARHGYASADDSEGGVLGTSEISANDSQSPSSPEMARCAAGGEPASPRERSLSSSLSRSSGSSSNLSSSSSLSSSNGLEGAPPPGGLGGAGAGAGPSGGTEGPEGEPSASGGGGTSSAGTTTTTTTTALGGAGSPGSAGRGEEGAGGRAPAETGPFMRDQRLDVVVEGWKANWKALDQDWKRKRRDALRAERRRRGEP